MDNVELEHIMTYGMPLDVWIEENDLYVKDKRGIPMKSYGKKWRDIDAAVVLLEGGITHRAFKDSLEKRANQIIICPVRDKRKKKFTMYLIKKMPIKSLKRSRL